MDFRNESIKIQRNQNNELPSLSFITFLFVLYVSLLYSLDFSNYRMWPKRYILDSYPISLYIHLHTMGDERDMFAGLGWEKEIKSLADPHIPVNLSPDFSFAAGNQSSDDYDLTPFS